jgi:hypothetical protein
MPSWDKIITAQRCSPAHSLCLRPFTASGGLKGAALVNTDATQLSPSRSGHQQYIGTHRGTSHTSDRSPSKNQETQHYTPKENTTQQNPRGTRVSQTQRPVSRERRPPSIFTPQAAKAHNTCSSRVDSTDTEFLNNYAKNACL